VVMANGQRIAVQPDFDHLARRARILGPVLIKIWKRRNAGQGTCPTGPMPGSAICHPSAILYALSQVAMYASRLADMRAAVIRLLTLSAAAPRRGESSPRPRDQCIVGHVSRDGGGNPGK
jgi:hypothetical protein